MKRITIFTILLTFLFLPLCIFNKKNIANAQTTTIIGTYAYIPNENVYLYSDEELSYRKGLFKVPCSYYVRILSDEKDYYRVEYLTDGSKTKKIIGYCRKSDIVPVNYIPKLPYLYYTLTITYTLTNALESDSFSSIMIECAYYGDYSDGTKTYAYVLRDNQFGYILKPETISYSRNTEYEDHITINHSEMEGKVTEKKGNPLSPVQITMIVLLCILIPAIATLILRPPNKPPYEQNDF